MDSTPATTSIGINIASLLSLHLAQVDAIVSSKSLAIAMPEYALPDGWPSEIVHTEHQQSTTRWYFQTPYNEWVFLYSCRSDIKSLTGCQPAFIYSKESLGLEFATTRPVIHLIFDRTNTCREVKAEWVDRLLHSVYSDYCTLGPRRPPGAQ